MKLIALFYVQKEHGRELILLETTLLMYLLQNSFGLSNEGIIEFDQGCHEVPRSFNTLRQEREVSSSSALRSIPERMPQAVTFVESQHTLLMYMTSPRRTP